MSRNTSHTRRTSGRRTRHPRPHAGPVRPERTREEQVLRSLPYRKGHLTQQELDLFAELRGPLSPEEVEQLSQVAKTLRRPHKRLRALDLMRYWGEPLRAEQHAVLPRLAGLAWHRPLPTTPGVPLAALAQHLLCTHEVPAFLLEPFSHPERYAGAPLHWEMCRLLATVGSGGGLRELCELNPFWTWVPPDVFERFVATSPRTPVIVGLIDAFVQVWGGPVWLAEQAYSWRQIVSLGWTLPPVLRVTAELCINPLPPPEAERYATLRLPQISSVSRLFGMTQPLDIPNVVPHEISEWTPHELRTPEHFEAEEARTQSYLTYSFQDAQKGKISLWTLRRDEQVLLVQVHVPSMRAWQVRPYRRGPITAPETEEQRIVALWATANGLKT